MFISNRNTIPQAHTHRPIPTISEAEKYTRVYTRVYPRVHNCIHACTQHRSKYILRRALSDTALGANTQSL